MKILYTLLFSFLVNFVHAQCVTSYPYTQGFETNSGNWTSGGTSNSWIWGSPTKFAITSAGGGTKCWVTGGLTGSTYNNGERSFVESPCFDFTTLTNPHLTMKIYWESEKNFDGITFQYSINNSSNWVTLGSNTDPVDCLNDNWFNTASCTNLTTFGTSTKCWTGNSLPNSGQCLGGGGSLGWVVAKKCMTQLAGLPNVKFRFVFGAGTNCSNFDGFAFDDIEIKNAPITPATFTTTCLGNNLYQYTNTSACTNAVAWNFGDPASGTANTSTQNNATHTFSGVGPYVVTLNATSACGVTAVSTQTINNLSANISSTDATCANSPNGSINIQLLIAAGTPTITINPNLVGNFGIYPNAGAGTYTVNIVDANGCTINTTLTITEPSKIFAGGILPTYPSCASTNDGVIDVAGSGGTGALKYKLLPNNITNTTGQFTNLSAGNYSVIVTDAVGCTLGIQYNLIAPSGVVINSINKVLPTCIPGSDGALTVITAGGTLPITYNIGNGFVSSNIFNNLSGGSYTVIAKDNKGCSTNTTVLLNAPQAPIFTGIFPIKQTCIGVADGEIKAIAQGASSYNLQPGNNTNTSGSWFNLIAGTYTVTAKNNNGCSITSTTTIIVSPALTLSNLSVKDVSCKTFDGIISGDAIGGNGLITFQLSNGTSKNDFFFNNLNTGSYIITATDAVGCSASTNTILKLEGACCDEIFIPSAFSPNNDLNNDYLRLDYLTNITLVEFAVYNRWGEKVFETAKLSQPWNGAFKGKDCEIGTYYYFIKYYCGSKATTLTQKGELLLLR